MSTPISVIIARAVYAPTPGISFSARSCDAYGAIFSFILSLNETVRTQLVEGAYNTVQTYIWSTYLQVGLSPTLYALMTLLILATLLFVLVLLLVNISRLRRAAPAS